MTSDDFSINYKLGCQNLNIKFTFLEFKKNNPRRRIKGLKFGIFKSLSCVNRANKKKLIVGSLGSLFLLETFLFLSLGLIRFRFHSGVQSLSPAKIEK